MDVKEEEKETRNIEIANFNCTFGEKDEPMLTHFIDVLFPAFTAKERMVKKDGYFIFENVRIEKSDEHGYMLVGNLIRETVVEVKSHYDKEKGLTPADERYPASPYSIFIIFLKNHRMVYYRNQKGSPIISSLKTMADYCIKKYLRKVNHGKDMNEMLPAAYIEIIPIASPLTIKESFKTIRKIKSVRYELFPLNGDPDLSDAFSSIRKQLTEVCSKRASVNVSSPTNIEKVAETIEQTRGVSKPYVKAITIDGNSIDLGIDTFKERIPITTKKTSSYLDKTQEIYDVIKEHAAIVYESNHNVSIYNEIKERIGTIIKR